MSDFTFIDLFAGIGGMRIAFEDLGGKCVFASEIEPHASKVYEDNFGVTPQHDIIELDPSDRKQLPRFDILLGGGSRVRPFHWQASSRASTTTAERCSIISMRFCVSVNRRHFFWRM